MDFCTLQIQTDDDREATYFLSHQHCCVPGVAVSMATLWGQVTSGAECPYAALSYFLLHLLSWCLGVAWYGAVVEG
jgi:hypothetical protein